MPKIYDAELVDDGDGRGRAAGPKSRQLPPERQESDAPLHVELLAWPAQAKARCVVREKGKPPREISVDGSALVMLLHFLNSR